MFIRARAAKALGVKLNVADDYIKAAVFLDSTSTVETLAHELAAQLEKTMPEFREALGAVAAGLADTDRTELGVWDTTVMMPLARCADGNIHLIVDGLDQPEEGARALILAAVQQLTATADPSELGQVRVIAGMRAGANLDTAPELAHSHRITVTAPTLAEIAQAATTAAGTPLSEPDMARIIGDHAAGGWLIARLVREIADHTRELPEFEDLAALVTARVHHGIFDSDTYTDTLRLLALIAAAGVGPVLPVRLLAAALGDNDTAVPVARIRNDVAKLGALITRGQPGTDHETLGIAHLALLQPILDHLNQTGSPVVEAHRALIDAHQRHLTHPDNKPDMAARDDVESYWTTAAPRHYLGSGDPQAAIRPDRPVVEP